MNRHTHTQEKLTASQRVARLLAYMEALGIYVPPSQRSQIVAAFRPQERTP